MALDARDFVHADFNPAAFVRAQRGRVDFETLSTSLDDVLRTLKGELVEVIHRDYANFLALARELGGTNHEVDALRTGLGAIEAELRELLGAVQAKVRAVEEIEAQQSAFRERRRSLQLYMELASGIERSEKLLAQLEAAPAPDGGADGGAGGGADGADGAEREASAHTLERIADLLQRGAAVIDLEGVPALGVDALERLAAARARARALVLLHATRALGAGATGACGAELPPALRAADTLGARAELVAHVREAVVRPRVSALVDDAARLPSVPDLAAALERCVRVELASVVRAPPGASEAEARARVPLQLVAGAVWPEVCAGLARGRAGLFAPGAPDAFHANYTACARLLAAVEAACADAAELAALRAHAEAQAFSRRWNLPLYFQLRRSEVTAAYEGALAEGVARASAEERGADAGHGALRLRASCALAHALSRCAAPGVALRALAHRFVRLALQLPARHVRWVHAWLGGDGRGGGGGEGGADADKTAASAAAPAAADAAAPAADPPPPLSDEGRAAACAALLADGAALAGWIGGGYAEALAAALELDEEGGAHGRAARACLREQADELRSQLRDVSAAAAAALARACGARLAPVRSIAAAYRFQAREMPTQPSDFMREVMQPCRAFVDAHASELPAEERSAVLEEAACAVAERHAQLSVELIDTVQRTETSIKRLQPRRTSAGGLADDAGAASTDLEKIAQQLRLDAASLRRQARELFPAAAQLPSRVADALDALERAISTAPPAGP